MLWCSCIKPCHHKCRRGIVSGQQPTLAGQKYASSKQFSERANVAAIIPNFKSSVAYAYHVLLCVVMSISNFAVLFDKKSGVHTCHTQHSGPFHKGVARRGVKVTCQSMQAPFPRRSPLLEFFSRNSATLVTKGSKCINRESEDLKAHN